MGLRPPELYKHRDVVPVSLVVVDQWDDEHKVTFAGADESATCSGHSCHPKHTEATSVSA